MSSSNNNKKNNKITAEQTIILIRLIKKYQPLWNNTHKDFRNRAACDQIYKKIGHYFHLTGEDVRRKFQRLRNNYREELKQTNNGQKKHSSLFYFEEMEFLRTQIEQRLLKRRISCDSITSNKKENTGETEGLRTELLEELFTIEPVEFDPADLEPEVYEPAYNESESAEEIQENDEPKFKVTDDQNSTASESISDEFDIFAGYLASQLREMDKLSALETMKELQQIISQRRIELLKKDLKRKENDTVHYRYSLKKTKDCDNYI